MRTTLDSLDLNKPSLGFGVGRMPKESDWKEGFLTQIEDPHKFLLTFWLLGGNDYYYSKTSDFRSSFSFFPQEIRFTILEFRTRISYLDVSSSTYKERLEIRLKNPVQNNDPFKAIRVVDNSFYIQFKNREKAYGCRSQDSTLIMQLLRDNLTLWTVDFDAEEDEDQY